MERRPTGSCERIETDPASHLTLAKLPATERVKRLIPDVVRIVSSIALPVDAGERL
jgi:hypothetical protein